MNETVVRRYLTAFDEINRLIPTSYYLALQEADRKKRADQVVDDVLDMLILGYQEGVAAAYFMLGGGELSPGQIDTDLMKNAIYLAVDGKTFEQRIREYVDAGDFNAIETVVNTEFHRVYNTAEIDGARQWQADTGEVAVKHWRTVNDDRVRDTHQHLEGAEVALDEEFFTYDNDHAILPGRFTKAENNVGCRCIVELVPSDDV